MTTSQGFSPDLLRIFILNLAELNITENWVMIAVGVFLIAFGFTMTAVSGPMPGAKPGYPPPLRFRLILISFGVFMSVLGVARFIRK